MQPELEKLLELQRTDTEIARLQQEIAALPHRVADIETKLADHMAGVEKAKTAAKTNEQNRRKYEAEIQTIQQKISKYRDQMLAVKTNDEYRALGNEIKFAEDNVRGFEDKILECMIQSEDLDKNIKATEKELALERAEVENEKGAAKSRTAEDEKSLSELLPRRAELRAGISEDTLRHYDRVLKQRGSAIGEVGNGICLACRVMLRPQVYNDVRIGDRIFYCDSCGRILYYDKSKEEPAAEPAKKASRRESTSAAVAADDSAAGDTSA